MRKIFLMAFAVLAACASITGAMAQNAIYTGSQGGAYNSTFCPPLPSILDNSVFSGYKCTPSGGTVDNINKVVAKASSIGFVQLDVLALTMQSKPELAKQISIIRSDIACEGLWMVTKNPALKTYGDVLGYARRLPFVLPGKESGSDASFSYLQSIDPDGLGRAKNIKYVQNAATMLNSIQGNEVGFFVQFADPENSNIKLMQEKGLTVIPMVSREITKAKVGDQDLYQVQSFNLTSGGIFTSGESKVTACTPVAVITGNPEAQSDRNAKDDQKEMIEVLRNVPASKLLPSEPRLAKILSSVHKIGAGALNEMLAAADKAKEAASKLGN
jgi:hypothetical protein